MNLENYHIYIVEGAEQTSVADTFKSKRRLDIAKRRKWCRKQGGDDLILNSYRTVGILAKPGAKILPGWRIAKRENMQFPPVVTYVPDRKSKVGKQVDKEMNDLRVGGSIDLAIKITAGNVEPVTSFMDGEVRFSQAQCFDENGNWLLIVPKQEKKPAPKFPGCRLLKMSEYYALKESVAV